MEWGELCVRVEGTEGVGERGGGWERVERFSFVERYAWESVAG